MCRCILRCHQLKWCHRGYLRYVCTLSIYMGSLDGDQHPSSRLMPIQLANRRLVSNRMFELRRWPRQRHASWSCIKLTPHPLDYWRYYEPIAQYAPKSCVNVTKDMTHAMDNIFIKPVNKQLRPMLKRAFGLQNVSHADDFQYTLSEFGILGWQSKNWDPVVSSSRGHPPDLL